MKKVFEVGGDHGSNCSKKIKKPIYAKSEI